MLSLRRQAAVIAGVILCALSLSGCGPRQGSLSGKVTLDGHALKGGTINFHNKSGGESRTASIGQDGTYTVASIFSGEYVVTVETDSLRGGGSSGPPAGSGAPPPGVGRPPKDAGPKGGIPEGIDMGDYRPSSPVPAGKNYMKIPSKYADPAQSGLTFSHPGGAQTYDIPLTSK
jgi:hypothetical protein